MDKLLTITLINKDDADLLPFQLDAIANQSILPDEVIIIDDGTERDESKDIIQKFYDENKEKLNVKIFLFDDNKGYNYRANYAIDISSSKYLLQVAANDRLALDIVENCYRGFELDAANVATDVSFPREGVYKGDSLIDSSFYIPGASSCIKKKYLQEVGGHVLDFQWHSDWFFMHSVAMKYDFYAINKNLCYKDPSPDGYANVGVESPKQLEVLKAMVEKVENDIFFEDIRLKMKKMIKRCHRSEEIFSLCLLDT